jgi:hypothetical protein
MRDDELLNHQQTQAEIDPPDRLAKLDQRLIHALEIAPQPQVPSDFAARVASQLPARRPVSVTPTHYGHYAMLGSMVLLLVALLFLAPQPTNGSAFGLTFQWILCAQFIGLAVWMSARRHGRS